MIKFIIKSVLAMGLLIALITGAFMIGEIMAEIKFDEMYEQGLIDQDAYDRYYNKSADDYHSDDFDLNTNSLKYIKI